MMEQPNMLLHKRNAQLLARLKYGAIILAAGGRRNVLGATACRAKHIVDEGEKRVGADGHTLQLLQPGSAFLRREGRRDVALFEMGLEVLALDARVGDEAGAEEVDSVRFGRPLGALFPVEAEGALVEAHPPVVGLVAGEASAVDASWSESGICVWGR